MSYRIALLKNFTQFTVTFTNFFSTCYFTKPSWRLLLNAFLLNSFKISHRRCSLRKGILRNFAKFTGKHLCQGLLSNKVAGGGLVFSLRIHSCFPVNFPKFLRTHFLQNTFRRLLLPIVNCSTRSDRLVPYCYYLFKYEKGLSAFFPSYHIRRSGIV